MSVLTIRPTHARLKYHNRFGQDIIDDRSSNRLCIDPPLVSVTAPHVELACEGMEFGLRTIGASSNFLVANPIDRHSIGDRTRSLVYADGGSLGLYFRHVEPTDPTTRPPTRQAVGPRSSGPTAHGSR